MRSTSSSAVVPNRKVHAVGYCLGGTLLSIAAAAMARDGDERLRSMTLFAAQTDFTEAGELMLFINESQLAFLEDLMWEQGFLDSRQMAGTFQMLRSNDLVWSRLVHEYLMGERRADDRPDGVECRCHAHALPHALANICASCSSTTISPRAASRRRQADRAHRHPRADLLRRHASDHVAPWRSTYKIHSADRRRGDLSPHHRRPQCRHRVGARPRPAQLPGHDAGRRDHYVDPDTFLAHAPRKDGSWWPEWVAWLDARSGAPVPPPAGLPAALGAPLADAPGTYVLED